MTLSERSKSRASSGRGAAMRGGLRPLFRAGSFTPRVMNTRVCGEEQEY
ncbi:hypothetical protein [Sediminimonas qiaohouensis]|nr:hypothetical protein [Sediminimonas qiaohouensis]